MKATLLLLILWLLPAAALADETVEEHNKSYIRPPFLCEGDTVAIVATSSLISQEADTAKVRAHFAAMGLYVKFGKRSFARDSVAYITTDSDRAADFQAAIYDPSVKAIIPFRGGYGAVRILDHIDLKPLHRNPKWIAGYSDITMLHLALAKEGIESIHGTMPGNFRYDTVDVAARSLRQALFGEAQDIELPPHPGNHPGKATGRLVGGNLSLIHAAAATPEAIDTEEPVVLLLEDVGEDAYRIDRMMQNLSRSGVLRNVSAILVGYFTKITKSKDFSPSNDVWGVLRSYTDPLEIPVVYGVPAGHEQPNMALYMGRRVYVEVDEEGAAIHFK